VRPDRGGQPRLRRTVRVCLTRERKVPLCLSDIGKDLDEIADQLIERHDLRRRQTAAG